MFGEKKHKLISSAFWLMVLFFFVATIAVFNQVAEGQEYKSDIELYIEIYGEPYAVIRECPKHAWVLWEMEEYYWVVVFELQPDGSWSTNGTTYRLYEEASGQAEETRTS